MTTATQPSSRFVFLDVARGLAVLWMIQVHITNVFLDPSIHQSTTFDALNVSNGYVAPTFIFLAGAGFWIAMSRKLQDFVRPSRPMAVYLRRLSYILWCAFMLHVPFYSFERMLIATPAEIMPFFQVDVLHTIVYTSLITLAAVMMVRSIRGLTIVSGIAALVIMSITWWVWLTWPPTSPFPLFPWSFYFFAGIMCTHWYMTSDHKEALSKIWIIGALLLPVALFTIKMLPFQGFTEYQWWKVSPSILLFNTSATLCLLGMLSLNEQRLQHSRSGRFLQVVGQESLFMYVSHLILVYGQGAQAIRRALHIPTMDYLGCLIVWIIITVPLLALMWKWHHLKRDQPELARRILVWQIAGMTIGFLVWPMHLQPF